jgi:regulatory protein
MATVTVLSLKGRALRLLGNREHSRAELERKLAAHEEEPGSLARTLDELEAKGFLNEQRVVESLVHRRGARLGASRVRQELNSRGLPAQAVQDAVEQLRATELDRAREVWRKKFGTPPDDAAERAKQMRFLAGRGFAGDVIRRVVGGVDEDLG